jgi:hypothetical protein
MEWIRGPVTIRDNVGILSGGQTGVANTKWLMWTEVRDHRYAGRLMARDYVSIREEPWPLTSSAGQRGLI